MTNDTKLDLLLEKVEAISKKIAELEVKIQEQPRLMSLTTTGYLYSAEEMAKCQVALNQNQDQISAEGMQPCKSLLEASNSGSVEQY
jgi:hypothetical protein